MFLKLVPAINIERKKIYLDHELQKPHIFHNCHILNQH